MLAILAYDGLEYNYVEEFDCKQIMQACYGKTDLSEFSEPRTMVIWASFLAGRNLEEEVLKVKDMWSFKLNVNSTFLSNFKNWYAIDMPALNQKIEARKLENEMLKKYFDNKITIEEYDALIFKHYKENKETLIRILEEKEEYDLVLAYFNLADMIGHLSFGVKVKMKIVYKELNDLAKEVRKYCDSMLIISDHGMKAIGRYGDHSNYGFWSFSSEINLQTPKVTEFRKFIENNF